MAYSMIMDAPGMVFADEKDRAEILEFFEWPDDAEGASAEAQDATARRAAKSLGLRDPEALVRQAAAARAAAQAALAESRLTDNPIVREN